MIKIKSCASICKLLLIKCYNKPAKYLRKYLFQATVFLLTGHLPNLMIRFYPGELQNFSPTTFYHNFQLQNVDKNTRVAKNIVFRSKHEPPRTFYVTFHVS